VNLSDLVRSEGFGFVVDPHPWTRLWVQGNPPNPRSFSALVCHPPDRTTPVIACVVDSLDHIYACAHEIAGDRRGHEHTEKMLSEQAHILARWARRLGDRVAELEAHSAGDDNEGEQ
jgi:hypothetical protein